MPSSIVYYSTVVEVDRFPHAHVKNVFVATVNVCQLLLPMHTRVGLFIVGKRVAKTIPFYVPRTYGNFKMHAHDSTCAKAVFNGFTVEIHNFTVDMRGNQRMVRLFNLYN